MSGQDLKEWMQRNEISAIDVASMLKIHPITVRRFLDGKRVQPIILAALKSLVREGPRKIAVG